MWHHTGKLLTVRRAASVDCAGLAALESTAGRIPFLLREAAATRCAQSASLRDKLAAFGIDTLHVDTLHTDRTVSIAGDVRVHTMLAVQRAQRPAGTPRNLSASCPPEPSMRWGWGAKRACAECHGEAPGERRRGWIDCCGKQCAMPLCHRAATAATRRQQSL
jgi:hypothetical protein